MIEVTRGQSLELFLRLNWSNPSFPAWLSVKGSGSTKLGDLSSNSVGCWVPEPGINVG
jgi:hypothetical protein